MTPDSLRDAALAEIERLRAENRDLFNSFPICLRSMEGGECSEENRWKRVVANVVAERDAALAEIERLRAFISSGALGVQVSNSIDLLVAQRNAALAEIERLRAANKVKSFIRETERDAWREDADRLAAMHIEAQSAQGRRPRQDTIDGALAAHDALKDRES